MARRRGKKLQAATGSGLLGEDDTDVSSPFIDDFDEELCIELEEVGKELDRYKAESLRVPDSDGGVCPSVVQSNTSSPPLEYLPQGSPEAPQSTSVCAVEPSRAEAEAVTAEVCPASQVSVISLEAREASEEESEYQLKALNSFKASLVTKLKMIVTHKTNLGLQKDSLLKNFDGDKAKLSENLQKHLYQCKEVDVQIQSLNAQITITRKKIIALKSQSHLSEMKNNKKQSDSSPAHEKYLLHTQSKVVKDSPVRIDEVCGKSKISLTEEEESERVGAETSNGAQNGNQINIRHETVHPNLPPPQPDPCKTPESLPMLTEQQEAKKSECLVVEKVASKLAMHPSSKNVNTLWCEPCNLFLTSITGYIKHLELPEHLKKEQEGELCLHKLLGHPKKTHMKGGGNTQEALGVEFLRSTRLIYCSLCECPLLTREEATSHSQSLQHTNKYKEYILKNTSKELAFQRAKMLAFTEYYKQRKATVRDKKQETEGKDEDSHRKAIPKVDENKSKVEAGIRRTELLKIRIPNEKKGPWPHSENNSFGLQEKANECRKLMKESPLMPQKINVNIKTEKSVVGVSIKRTSETPPANKRQKIID